MAESICSRRLASICEYELQSLSLSDHAESEFPCAELQHERDQGLPPGRVVGAEVLLVPPAEGVVAVVKICHR